MLSEFIFSPQDLTGNTVVIRKKRDFFFWKKIRGIYERDKIPGTLIVSRVFEIKLISYRLRELGYPSLT